MLHRSDRHVDVIRRATAIVADVPNEVAAETGDMIAAAEARVEFATKLCSLEAIVQRRISPRPAPVEIILYKSVGSARQDITVAELCLTRARTLGLASRLRNTSEPVAK
jgi:alanine dehydrogenase